MTVVPVMEQGAVSVRDMVPIHTVQFLGLLTSRNGHTAEGYVPFITHEVKDRAVTVWCTCGESYHHPSNPCRLGMADLVRAAWMNHPCMHPNLRPSVPGSEEEAQED
jgi:hypothetical protein